MNSLAGANDTIDPPPSKIRRHPPLFRFARHSRKAGSPLPLLGERVRIRVREIVALRAQAQFVHEKIRSVRWRGILQPIVDTVSTIQSRATRAARVSLRASVVPSRVGGGERRVVDSGARPSLIPLSICSGRGERQRTHSVTLWVCISVLRAVPRRPPYPDPTVAGSRWRGGGD